MTVWRMGLHSNGKRIWLTFPYNMDVSETLKENMQGGRWDKNNRFWTYPLDMQVARDIVKLSKTFQDVTVIIEPELKDWARLEKERYSSLIKPDDMTTDQLMLLPRLRQERPELVAALADKPWQLPGAAFTAAQKRVLLADQPGLGKTVQAIAAVLENDIRGPILVVAPRTAVAVTWPEEIARWLGPYEDITVINATLKPQERKDALDRINNLCRVGYARDKRLWVLCGPNYLRIKADVDHYGNYLRDSSGRKIVRTVNEGLAELFALTWRVVIVDESHQTLAGSTGDKKKQSAQRRGLGALHIDPHGMQIAMSGTPFRGKTENLWGTLNWLEPEKYTSYWNWIQRHYGVQQSFSTFGPSVVKGPDILDEKRFFKELKPIMVRRTKAEVEKDLPPKTYGGVPLDPSDPDSPVAVWLPMSKAQKKQYDQIVKDALIVFEEMGDELVINGILAEMVRMKQVANSAINIDAVPVLPSNKIDWIIDFLKERIEAGTKTIVASQFTKFIETLSKELGYNNIDHYVFTGKTKDVERAKIRTEFQKSDGEMVILLNTKSGGVSLTLDAADDVIVCDQTWIPDDQEQVEDRAHRISRFHNVTVWNLASLETIDEDIAILNSKRKMSIASILDEQRGVVYVKQLVAATRKRMEKV